jgi:hypothetical protein
MAEQGSSNSADVTVKWVFIFTVLGVFGFVGSVVFFILR